MIEPITYTNVIHLTITEQSSRQMYLSKEMTPHVTLNPWNDWNSIYFINKNNFEFQNVSNNMYNTCITEKGKCEQRDIGVTMLSTLAVVSVISSGFKRPSCFQMSHLPSA